jgi:hypothetical protein
MNIENKIDLTLKMLYNAVNSNDGVGGIYPKKSFEDNGLTMTVEEEEFIIGLLKQRGLVVSQSSREGKRIYFDSHNRGLEFVENDSFTMPGTSILDIPVD